MQRVIIKSCLREREMRGMCGRILALSHEALIGMKEGAAAAVMHENCGGRLSEGERE